MEVPILAVLLLLSAFFSGVELAFFSLSKIHVREMIQDRKPHAELIYKLKNDPQKLLITILIGNNLVNIGAASYATVVATRLFGDGGVGIATGVMTLLVLIFGEITPKAFCSRYAELITTKTAVPIYTLMLVLSPVSLPLGWMVRLVTGHEIDTPLVTDEKVKRLAEIGIEEGTVEPSESEMIANVFHLHDLTANDLLTPLTQAVLINGHNTIKNVQEQIIQSAYSRVPVYQGKLSNVIGVVHRDDVLMALYEGRADEPVEHIMRVAQFCQGSINAQSLLRKMQGLRTHICIVKEQGIAVGIITMEDILEEVVGNILDETDLEEQFIRRLSKNVILALGKTHLVDINNYFNIRLTGWDTLEEYLQEAMEEPIVKGSVHHEEHLRFQVVETAEDKISVVRITKC